MMCAMVWYAIITEQFFPPFCEHALLLLYRVLVDDGWQPAFEHAVVVMLLACKPKYEELKLK